jgi:uncharacterized protein (UPF0335 family)
MTADGQIKSFFQRWENLEAEKKQVADLMKDLFIEAKGIGYQPKAMRAAFRLKTKQDLDSPADAEFEAVVDIYLDALNSSARNARLRTREKIEEFDQTTGEFLEDEQPETATTQRVYGHSQHEGENAQATVRNEVVTVVGTESGTVSNSEIATASQGEAEAPSVERVSPAETNTGSAAANTGGDHEVANTQSFAAQAGAPFSKTAPAKLLRPHCRTPKNCGSGTVDHCHSCKVAMREREMA